jgi:acetylornithine/succinyldiaminopimelate/putrescine aminotransferase
MVTLAKPLGGGLPLGVVLSGTALDGLLKPGLHGTTFGGNPVACRLGLEVLDEIEKGGLLSRVEQLGAWFGKAAKRLKKKQPAIVDVRGRGLIWGIELDREASPVQKRLLAKGWVVGTARTKVLRLLPPYVVPKAALRGFLTALDETLKETNP